MVVLAALRFQFPILHDTLPMQGCSPFGLLAGIPRVYGQETQISMGDNMVYSHQLYNDYSPHSLHLPSPPTALVSCFLYHIANIMKLIWLQGFGCRYDMSSLDLCSQFQCGLGPIVSWRYTGYVEPVFPIQ